MQRSGVWLRPVRMAMAIAVSALLSGGAAGADLGRVLYASATAAPGDRSATGTLDKPMDLRTAFDSLRSGDTLHLLPGVYREINLTLQGLSDVTISTAPGSSTRAVLRGDRPIIASSWFAVTPSIYAAAQLSKPVGVVWNWDANLTAPSAEEVGLGRIARHFGHLREAPTSESLVDTPGSWLWSEGFLLVHPPAQGLAPTEGDEYAVLRAGVAMQPFNCQRLTVRDIDFELFSQFSSNAGYSVKMTNCVESVIEDSTSWDSGWHAYGFVGFPNRDNVIRRCESRGQATNGAAVSNPFVFANTVENKGLASGFLGADLGHQAYSLLDHNGEPLVGGYSGLSLLSHGTRGSTIGDIEWSRVDVMTYEREPRCVLVSANDSPAPLSDFDATRYPVRVSDARIRSANPTVAGPISVTRGAFDARPARIWTIGAPAAIRIRARQTLFSACTFVFDMSNAPNGQLFRVDRGGRLVMVHSTLYSISKAEHGGSGRVDGNRGLFVTVEDDDSEFVTGATVFVRDAPAPFFRDRSTLADRISLSTCWYAGFPPDADGADAVGPVGATDTEDGGLIPSFDPAGIFRDDTGMAAPHQGDFTAPPDAPIRTIRRPNAWPSIAMGINGAPYSGHLGAVQYGLEGCAGDLNADGVVNGADLGLLLGGWGASGSSFDLTGDGVVDGADLGVIFGAWGACAG